MPVAAERLAGFLARPQRPGVLIAAAGSNKPLLCVESVFSELALLAPTFLLVIAELPPRLGVLAA